MARKKQVLVIQDQEPDDVDETTPDIDELRAISEMEGGGDVKWTVFRTSDIGNKKAGYCGTLSTGDVSFQKIAEEWGVGSYRIRGTRSNGQFVKQQTVIISEEPKRPVQTLMPTSAQSTVQDYIALLEAREEKQSEKMLKWAAILSPLLAPALSNLFSGAKGTTLTELTAALANIKQLEGGSKVDQMSEFTKLLELVDRVKGDDKPAGSTWPDIVRDGISAAAPMVAALAASRGVKLPALSGAPAAAPPAVQEDNPMLKLMAWLKVQLEALAYQASMNKDPGLYAEVMIDNLPAGADPKMLLEYLEKPDWWALLTGFHPPVQAYPQWFAECRESLIHDLKAVLAPPALPAGAAGVVEVAASTGKSKKSK